MMFLLVLVYLSAAASISEEIYVDPRSTGHRNILKVKDQAKSPNVTVLRQCNQYALTQYPLLPQQVLMFNC